jgi:hypothetical protein
LAPLVSCRGKLSLLATLAALALPSAAAAHLERPSYWPDPAPDESVNPPAGGAVPKARSLKSAVTGTGPGEVRVVCLGENGSKSLQRLRSSLTDAVERGYVLRPSQPNVEVSDAKAEKLLELNRALAEDCAYHSIQAAVDDSHNNDRVVIMPGRYREPKSRRSPVNDPKCAGMTQQDSSGALTPSYAYQVNCPNDQNLIYVQGRKVPSEPPPSPPLANRQGIPDEGKCVRCNFQIEGSGVSPQDVLIDGGKNYKGKGIEARPGALKKHVILRVDRADGFVARNLLTRGALEHGIYVEETDGYLLDRVKFFWAADYGNLTFTSDHGLYRNCDGFGSGDSVVYPGAAPETGAQADASFYPDAPRFNTVVKKCDMRGSALAYSGSMGNSVRITRNNVYGNGSGLSTDTISASGHPGFPADGVQIDHNLIYSNNLNLYVDDPPVEPVIGVPVGVGILWPGHNDGRVFGNWIFDNWRRGTMLLAIPDAIVTPEGNVNPGVSCPTAPVMTTSCNNRYFDNHMGQAPPDFTRRAWSGLRFDTPHGDLRDRSLPNGVDFWWDEWSGNTGNCWFDNTGADGTAASVTGPGAGAPPEVLPSDCAASTGAGDPAKTVVLLDCSMWERGETAEDFPQCDWFTTPPEPGSAAAMRRQARSERELDAFLRTAEAQRMRERLAGYSTPAAASARARGAEPVEQGPAALEGFGVDPLGPVTAGSVARLAQCRDWRAGTRARRMATVYDVRSQINLEDGPVEIPTLTDEEAYELFQNACAEDFARGFRLYKIYARATGYAYLARR